MFIKQDKKSGEFIFECCCKGHLIRIWKDEGRTNKFGTVFPPQHNFLFYEFRGDTNWTRWDRIKLGFRILFGFEAKNATYDFLIENSDIDDFISVFQFLKEPGELKPTIEEIRKKMIRYGGPPSELIPVKTEDLSGEVLEIFDKL